MVIGQDQQHFYVRELAYADHHGFVIPIQWYVQEEKLYGDFWAVSRKVTAYYLLVAPAQSLSRL